MERGTISSVRDEHGNDVLADVELMRLALPRRVFTLSQVMYVADRLIWLYQNRELVGGLKFPTEPTVLRFFLGRLAPVRLAGEARREVPQGFRRLAVGPFSYCRGATAVSTAVARVGTRSAFFA